MSNEKPDVSIIIVSFNTCDLLRDCLNTIKRTAKKYVYEIIVVDNASQDNSPQMVAKEFPDVILLQTRSNLGFAAANNIGFRHAQGRYWATLNSDAFLKENALDLAIEKMDADDNVGLAGGKLIGDDGSWQPSARKFPSVLNDVLRLSGLAEKFSQSRFFGRADRTWASPNTSAEVDWVPGAFFIVRPDVFKKIGGFDERFFFYYEEVDLCRRIKNLGYSIWYWPEVVIVHLGGQSSKKDIKECQDSTHSKLLLWRMRSEFLYHRKHEGFVGAWSSFLLEYWWYKLRYWHHRRAKEIQRQCKKRESLTMINIKKQAWRETKRGRLTPTIPW